MPPVGKEPGALAIYAPSTARDYGLVVNGLFDERRGLLQEYTRCGTLPAYLIQPNARLAAGDSRLSVPGGFIQPLKKVAVISGRYNIICPRKAGTM